MKTTLHKADTRGHANHGWLNSYHTFSFANYYHPERVHFGALRVLNDDTVEAGAGFGKHPHRDMEIISIPLEGKLTHGDNMGNKGTISKGQVQVMSAGTGIIHSEMNGNNDELVKFLQIWVIPREVGVAPRYGELTIDNFAKVNDFQQIVSPNINDEGLWIKQDAWFILGDFEKGNQKTYQLKKEGNGVYVFVIEGNIKIGNQILNRRDGLGIEEVSLFNIEALEKSEFLIMEVPMIRLA